MIDPRLAEFLQGLVANDVDRESWPDGHEFELTTYFTTQLPPTELITSSRGIVIRGRELLVFEDDVRSHIVPGGRVEAGESPVGTLLRELREEVGIEVEGEPTLLGFVRFHHIGPKPDGYRYPYPDDTHVVYAARCRGMPRAGVNEPLVRDPRFCDLKALATLDIPGWERAFLRAPIVQRIVT